LRFLIDVIVAIVVATVVGVFTAWLAVEKGPLFGAVTVGEWTAWPHAGGPDADPYSLAVLARTGEVPLGAGEGLSFTAERDSDGESLDGHCTYAVVGQTPSARLWTLTAYDATGRLMVNAAYRTGFHSREIVRREDGSFVITVSPKVASGNWLPVAPVERFKLVLRLYDTPLTSGTHFADLTMPAIRKVSCS
jgi:hypothetical protein